MAIVDRDEADDNGAENTRIKKRIGLKRLGKSRGEDIGVNKISLYSRVGEGRLEEVRRRQRNTVLLVCFIPQCIICKYQLVVGWFASIGLKKIHTEWKTADLVFQITISLQAEDIANFPRPKSSISSFPK
ncbi:hypothetical protein HPP92_004635 [Vanilla planifolia]|uniref:Uncharacterized protein n=1 Tax=Vanilla planifolia TaxID=51239 RepID=A0A835RSQ3_VANPL|nr:hypothetical protein HPP92_004635 [Vanilla planifolia]